MGSFLGWASLALPTRRKRQSINYFGSLRTPKPSFKNVMKKEFSLASNVSFFFTAIPNFFFIPPSRQSTPLGLFRGGRATQKVSQTKNPLGKEVTAENVWTNKNPCYFARPFFTWPFVNRNSELGLSNVWFDPTQKLPISEKPLALRYAICTLRGEGVFNEHPPF